MARVRNVEIKARCSKTDVVRRRLEEAGARYVGLDRQTDTYFRSPSGRLKLRQGSIENSLIAYQRADESGPRLSAVSLYRTKDSATLREVLVSSLPIDVVVEKYRHIYFLDNVKVHVDTVPPLG
ncbi:MAG: class IV adenylate cyclase, partial [Acidimicrobiia bacterium]|nr:class IV adenylate cyclase [Acidimicrobiia bacterium]